jgi:hypothetical protein
MSLRSDGGMIYWQGKTEELGEKPVPVPLSPPQIPHGLTRARTRGERPATNDLSHGTAKNCLQTNESFQIITVTNYLSDYRLDGNISNPTEAKDFFLSLWVQTISEAHPASYRKGTGAFFCWGKARPGRDADHWPPCRTEVNEQEL